MRVLGASLTICTMGPHVTSSAKIGVASSWTAASVSFAETRCTRHSSTTPSGHTTRSTHRMSALLMACHESYVTRTVSRSSPSTRCVTLPLRTSKAPSGAPPADWKSDQRLTAAAFRRTLMRAPR